MCRCRPGWVAPDLPKNRRSGCKPTLGFVVLQNICSIIRGQHFKSHDHTSVGFERLYTSGVTRTVIST